MSELNWHKVAMYLENASRQKQDEANYAGVHDSKRKAEVKGEAADLLRAMAAAIRAGL